MYNVSAPGFPPNLTPQAGFSLWYDQVSGSYERVMGERRAWAALVDEGMSSGKGYPQRRDAAQQVIVIDPTEWPGNPSCPWGT